MDCPKCKKDTCVMVTKETKKVTRDRWGLVWRIVLFPFWLIYRLWILLFGRKQKYEKIPHWHCNYCGHEWKPEKE